ncbi:hypothetical protein CRG98_025858 [Punica granatum]|uniref:Uncharacterized protein n=1 Tax=Punica granatum TaxID=22663 RepID=A0A2I0JBV5_PUNGR|nr:hypothetical protein CRG98_025858 [Punica granatum]
MDERVAKAPRRHHESSRDIMTSFKERMTKVENVIAEGTLNAVVDEHNRHDDTLEMLVTAICTELDELKVELAWVKMTRVVGASVVIPGSHLDIPKPSVFKGSRVAKDVDNFLRSMETYFRAAGVEDDEVCVGTVSMYLVNDAAVPAASMSFSATECRKGKAMSTAESLVEFRSDKSNSKGKGKANSGGDKPHELDDMVITGKYISALVDTSESNLFISEEGAKKLGFRVEQIKGRLKTVNSKEVPTYGIARDIEIRIYQWCSKEMVEMILLNDYDFVIGMDFLDRVDAFIMSFVDCICILDARCQCIMLVARVLTEFKDVMPQELPKKRAPKREVDHRIELMPDAPPPAMAPYRMASPALEELRATEGAVGYGLHSALEVPYGAPILFHKKHDRSLQMYIDYRMYIIRNHLSKHYALPTRVHQKIICLSRALPSYCRRFSSGAPETLTLQGNQGNPRKDLLSGPRAGKSVPFNGNLESNTSSAKCQHPRSGPTNPRNLKD